jgi:hypothetical protein
MTVMQMKRIIHESRMVAYHAQVGAQSTTLDKAAKQEQA